jgi:ADP-ribosyl-[dinitrogen reductase] hydrolase
MSSMHRSHRVAGALVGSAVGDALGAPFTCSAPGQFSARFPVPARGSETEMCGGGRLGLEPGEFTDATQLALVVAESLIEQGGLEDKDLFDRLRSWTGRSVVPMTSAAIWFSRFGTEATMDAARRISALTDGDPEAGAAFHELMRVALDGEDPRTASEAGGTTHPTVEQAVEALRHGRDFAEVMRLAIDLGGDTAAVAAVAGCLAGAVFGMGGIPMRWSSAVHGRVPRSGDRRWGLADLQELAAALDGKPLQHYSPGVIPRIGPQEILPGIWAGNLDGARYSEKDFAIISLCRLGDPFPHEVHRMAYIADNDHNHDVDAVLADVLEDMAALRAEGRRLLVHCHGGASRTGLVLRAWLMRTERMSAAEATSHVAERWPHLGLWNASFTAALHRVSRAEEVG